MQKIRREAEIFGKYIIGKKINDIAIERYILGLEKLDITNSNAIIEQIIKYPFLLPYYDAGMAILNKKHLLQRKLLLMFSILETMPDYHKYFLAKKRSFFYLITIFFIGVVAVFKTFIGIIILKFFTYSKS